ncbi:unnamed protein product [Lactuca saligna]|uniref:Uncharacterized protein n=1 Tax=Lactuca saligna TaxID=75948 RepID=A0AA35ZSG7_LACSI|nr:unnamed protein product [Lactuca saligna]
MDEEVVPETPLGFSSPSTTSTPNTTIDIPPEDLVTKSFTEEVPTSGILAHVSNTDANVLMGDVVSNPVAFQGGFGGTFANLEFGHEEESIPDHMLTFGKQFKILDRKLNSILQSQVDVRSKHSVSGIEVDVMLKA